MRFEWPLFLLVVAAGVFFLRELVSYHHSVVTDSRSEPVVVGAPSGIELFESLQLPALSEATSSLWRDSDNESVHSRSVGARMLTLIRVDRVLGSSEICWDPRGAAGQARQAADVLQHLSSSNSWFRHAMTSQRSQATSALDTTSNRWFVLASVNDSDHADLYQLLQTFVGALAPSVEERSYSSLHHPVGVVLTGVAADKHQPEPLWSNATAVIDKYSTSTSAGPEISERNGSHGGGVCRLLVGSRVARYDAEASCRLGNQGGGFMSPFRSTEVTPQMPLFLSTDLILYVLRMFGRPIVHTLQVVEEWFDVNGMELLGGTSSNVSISKRQRLLKRELDRILQAVPVLAACGVPLSLRETVVRKLSQTQHGGISAATVQAALDMLFPEPPIPTAECIALFFAGRDVHRLSWAELPDVVGKALRPTASNRRGQSAAEVKEQATGESERRQTAVLECLEKDANISAAQLASRLQLPYAWLSKGISEHCSATHQCHPSPCPKTARLHGLPYRTRQGGTAMYPVTEVRIESQSGAHLSASMPGPLEAASALPSSTPRSAKGPLGVFYIPTRIDYFSARDTVRCYYRSLSQSAQSKMPLHFVLGARSALDAHFIFRSSSSSSRNEMSSSYISPLYPDSVWHKLAAENSSSVFSGGTADPNSQSAGGELLLFDVPDLDGAPFSLASCESCSEQHNRGYASSGESLFKVLRGKAVGNKPLVWHGPSDISAMLVKLLVSMAHMSWFYPDSSYFIRGADDAFISFQRVYIDLVRWSAAQKEAGAVSFRVKLNRSRNHAVSGDRADEPSFLTSPTALAVANAFVFYGHVTQRAMLMRCGRHEISQQGVLRVTGAVADARDLAPAVYPWYVTGGGSVMSGPLVEWLVASNEHLPPMLWMEEDVMLGRITAPIVLPLKQPKRFYNFFNATRYVDYAFQGKVPRAFQYCSPEENWIVHKYPWGALRYVDDTTHGMYCSKKEFGGRRAHSCARRLDERFKGATLRPKWRLGNDRFYEPHEISKKAKSRNAQKKDYMAGDQNCKVQELYSFFRHLPRIDCQ